MKELARQIQIMANRLRYECYECDDLEVLQEIRAFNRLRQHQNLLIKQNKK